MHDFLRALQFDITGNEKDIAGVNRDALSFALELSLPTSCKNPCVNYHLMIA
jgi:hypothetical protein